MTTREVAQQIATSLIADAAYSAEFVEAEIATTVPFQIRAMRRERGWTQKDLAERTEQNQKTISDFENPDIGPRSVTSLLRIARAFDVGLIVRFAPLGEIVDWSARMSKRHHFVPSRTKDARLRAQARGTRTEANASTTYQWGLNFAGDVVSLREYKQRNKALDAVDVNTGGSMLIAQREAS